MEIDQTINGGLRRIVCLAVLLVCFFAQGWAEEYNLYICGVQVTDENKNNLSNIEGVKGGDIYFDGTALSLYYASIDATGITVDGESVDGIIIGQGLTLRLIGQNSIKSDKAGLKMTAVTTISGSESFNVEGKEQGIYAKRASANASDILKPFLTISGGVKVSARSEGYGIYGSRMEIVSIEGEATEVYAYGEKGSFCNLAGIMINSDDGLELVDPDGAKVSSGGGLLTSCKVVDAEGNQVKGETVIILKPYDIDIDENNFPDEKFRNWLLAQEFGSDGILSYKEMRKVKSMDVSGQDIADLTGIRYFTALKHLDCHGNLLTELNTWGCAELEWIDCSQNQIVWLNIYDCPALTYVNCENNQLKVNGMGDVVEALPLSGGTLYVYNASSPEGNKMTTEQVQAATEKGWTPMMYDGGGYVNYVGVEPGIDIDKANFRDENFRAWLKAQPYGADEYITNGELAEITEMDVSGQGIEDLSGIQYFTELKTLKCNDNKISYLWLNNNPAITELWCYNNQMWGYCVNSLLGSLPNHNGVIRFASDSETEDNAMTTTQVETYTNKGWQVLTADGAAYEGINPGIKIDKTTFYDDQLRYVFLRGVDSDVDGYLNSAEIKHTTTLDISNRPTPITGLWGLEYLTSLTELICWGNKLPLTADRYLPETTGGVIRFIRYDRANENSMTQQAVKNINAKGWRVLKSGNGTDWEEYKGGVVYIEENFPDERFREYVSRYTDIDRDGFLGEDEIQSTTTLDLSERNITTLKGVEHLSALKVLDCYNNKINDISDLPDTEDGELHFYKDEPEGGNSLFPAQIRAAEAKGWRVLMWNGSDWVDYPGVITPGDANGDGEVNEEDFATVRDYILGLNPTPFSPESADLSDDGTVDIVDLTRLIEMVK